MIKYLALFVLLLSACTQNKNATVNPPAVVQKIQVQGDGAFNIVEFGSRPIKSLVIKNNESISLSLNPALSGQNSDKFYVATLGCSNVLPGKNCLIKVVFDGDSEAGSYAAVLTVGSQTINLSAQIESVPAPAYQVVVNNQLVSGPLDLGSLVGRNIQILTIKFINNSPKVGNSSSLTIDNPLAQLIYNGCYNVSLKPKQSCSAKVVVSGNNTNENITLNLSFDNKVASLSAQGFVDNKQSNLVAMESSISLGDFYEEGKVKIQLIKIVNTGDAPGSLSGVTLPPEYTLANNNCNNVKPGNTCIIRLVYTAPDQDLGNYTSEATIGSGTVSLETNRVTDPNKLGSLSLAVAENILINSCSPVDLLVKDVNGLDYVSSEAITLTANQTLFTDSDCALEDDLIISSFESEKHVFIKSASTGVKNLQISLQSKNVQKDILFYAPLQVTPLLSGLHQGSSLQVNVSGGKLPYVYEVLNGGVGSVSNSGLYSATLAGQAVVKVTDSLGLTGESSFLICLPGYSPAEDNLSCTPDYLYITDSCATVDLDGTCQLSANGGVAPYSWSTTGGSISNTGLFTATCSGDTNSQITLTDSIGQTAMVTTAQGCWPFGADGSLTLAAGNYQLQKTAANNLQVVNTTTSAIVKSSFGVYENSGSIQETCKVDLSTLSLATGATLSVAPECKWLILGVKNNAIINGQIKANNLVSAGSFISKTPDNMGNLVGPALSLSVIQKNGANGLNGTASSSGALGGSGGAALCGNGGGGGGGAGINNAKRYPYGFTRTHQSFTVPNRATKIRYKLWGAGGASDNCWGPYNNGNGGAGGFVYGVINSTPGDVWNIVVGGGGNENGANAATSAFGGGGVGGMSAGADFPGYRSGGGGLTGIFKGAGVFDQSLFLAIAGGGGGASSRDGWSGGGGGGGYPNNYNRGLPGSTSGPGCTDGVTGSGPGGGCGSGMYGGTGGQSHNGGGGGGGGYFGGGGGNSGAGAAGGGGGGGSSYANSTYATASYETGGSGGNITPGGSWDGEYGPMGSPGRGGTGGGVGVNGAAVLYVEGDLGESGAAATCSAAGSGGLGSVNYGGDGGAGGIKGTHGQGLFVKVRGNISGTGTILAAGTNGSNGTAGSVGGGSYGNGGQGGGGAGGSGGKIYLYYRGALDPNLIFSVSGGTAGNNAQNGDNGQLVNQSF